MLADLDSRRLGQHQWRRPKTPRRHRLLPRRPRHLALRRAQSATESGRRLVWPGQRPGLGNPAAHPDRGGKCPQMPPARPIRRQGPQHQPGRRARSRPGRTG
jgi:hypothetical protein